MNEFQFLQEQAYQYLRNKIRNDELLPDQVYSESQIARELDCSRTPVKDALTRLSHAKYIDIIPSKGFRLHRMTEDDLTSTFQTRVAVESYCALSIMERREHTGRQSDAEAVARSAANAGKSGGKRRYRGFFGRRYRIPPHDHAVFVKLRLCRAL